MRWLQTWLGLATSLLVASHALAFCRTTTCAQKDPPARCLPEPAAGVCQTKGKPLFWADSCVSFSVQKDGSPKRAITADDLQGVIQLSFDNWHNASCSDGRNPNISVEALSQVECSEVRYNTNAKNQNLWTFRDDVWPHDDPTNSMIALTSVTFDKDSGEIYDVDVELNSAFFNLTLETSQAGTDLQSVVQHESGHFLGLAHTDVVTSTMYYSYGGDEAMRTLETDDANGICAVYPPTDNPDTSCDPTPRHGFSTKCNESLDDGCSLVRPRTAAFHGVWTLGLAALTLLLRRRTLA